MKWLGISGRILLGVTLSVAVACSTSLPPAEHAYTNSFDREVTYANPILDEDFPDPAIMRASDGYYYAYATQTLIGDRRINIQVAQSRDLINWTHLGDVLPVKPPWANQTQNFWAPHVSEHDGVFYMYYSAEPDTRDGLCLAVATAKSAAGPFTDVGEPLQCGKGFINIDPMAFDDPQSGKRLLYWGSGFEPIKVRELAPDRTRFLPGSRTHSVVFPAKGADARPYQRLVEGAWLTYRPPYYYLFYSGDDCCGEHPHYAVMVARSLSPLGPFVPRIDAAGNAQHIVLEQKDHWLAPGHNAIATDSAGQDWIFYHAIAPSQRWLKQAGRRDVRRVMLMDRIVYHNGWPQIGGGQPSKTPQHGPAMRRAH
jgi:arabinan endo-1,5-alpha-L-arabinosidase